MKLMNTKLFALLVLFGISNLALGYTFGIKNDTKEPLYLGVKVRGGNEKQALIEPGKDQSFTFGGFEIGLCLEKIFAAKEEDGARFSVPIQYKEGAGLMELSLCKSRNFVVTQVGEEEWSAAFQE
jgi:hypothetical protein